MIKNLHSNVDRIERVLVGKAIEIWNSPTQSKRIDTSVYEFAGKTWQFTSSDIVQESTAIHQS